MKMFFFICEYLGVTPKEFFDNSAPYPELVSNIAENLNKMNRQQLENIDYLVKEILGSRA